MITEFIDRQAINADLYELEDVETGETRQYRIKSKATITVPGTDLNKATLDPILNAILSAQGIVDSGGDASTGYWLQFDDGTMICYRYQDLIVPVQTDQNGFKRSDWVDLGNFPKSFTSLQFVTADCINPWGDDYYALVTGVRGASTSSAGKVALLCTKPAGGVCGFRYFAAGRWK